MPRLFFLLLLLPALALAAPPPVPDLPAPHTLLTDPAHGQLLLHATVQHPTGKPCIDAFGQRAQAFIGCATADHHPASQAAYFVFLVDVPTEDVYHALLTLGARPTQSYSHADDPKHAGLSPHTTPDDYLQGTPVSLSIFWNNPDGSWTERPYQDFVTEQIDVNGAKIQKPWTPSFVFHGSGALFHAGTGCIACPCDCAGGLIADNRCPLDNPKPTVRFNTPQAPPPGTDVYIRIRTATSLPPPPKP